MGKEDEVEKELHSLPVSVLVMFRKEQLESKEMVEKILRKRNEVPKDEFLELHEGRGCKVFYKNLGRESKPISVDPEEGEIYFYLGQLICTKHSVTSTTFDLKDLQAPQLEEMR
jgi:hypothetical protein